MKNRGKSVALVAPDERLINNAKRIKVKQFFRSFLFLFICFRIAPVLLFDLFHPNWETKLALFLNLSFYHFCVFASPLSQLYKKLF